MAWNHDDVGPNRSRDELLGEVVRRGERLRRRRRAVTGLAGCIALLLAVAGVAAVAGPGAEPATHLAAGGRASTVVPRLQANASGATFPVDVTSTTAPAATTTTVGRRPVTTTVPVISETTEPVPTTTAPTTVPDSTVPDSTVPGPAQPRCSPAQMEVTLTFSQPSYRAGDQAVGHAVLRNRSGAPCYYYSYTQSQDFKNAAGTPVTFGQAMIADAFRDTPFAPGQTLTADPRWDLKLCVSDPSCPPAPPGTYSGTVSWSFDGPPVQATTSFQIVP